MYKINKEFCIKTNLNQQETILHDRKPNKAPESDCIPRKSSKATSGSSNHFSIAHHQRLPQYKLLSYDLDKCSTNSKQPNYRKCLQI